ncbi:sugar ABC transporter ATP-binding protein [Conexibacter stalactiti]|uniref:Sugar ABC transporter ATP-binding protein n=1 Tax=Conexibacter stalactiti TaxID=1940611 RepID=A0ABU4HLH7_9ACTN|nr:sugar ABC transporter ATP-binding protein [Conexibacter stalactiti]MDW5593579.1 sugar ABC transporter ATP-binding protein [Conexibacter stalactiti]MEC5034220.1 sugar ABC transporter ATP-binding protein [Conexibacter stalactiti]
MTHVLETERLGKKFAGVPALSDVDLVLHAGEIHALVGHNGAGKSTLVKILTGVHPSGSYTGTVRVDGAPVAFASPAAARDQGVAYVPQEIQVVEQLSVAENLFVGQTGLETAPRVSFRELRRRAGELLGRLEIPLDPRAPVAALSATQRQLVMIARALTTDPRVLILDEPTASLAGTETERLFAVLDRLRAAGTTMVFITHRIPEVMRMCDRATVLRDGRKVAEIARADFSERGIVAAMVGREVDHLYPTRSSRHGEQETLRLDHVSVPHPTRPRDVLRDVSFTARRGEIVGIAGVVGAGRTELLSAIYGALPHTGTIAVEGEPQRLKSPADARRAGISMLTEDRKGTGLLFNFALRENITAGNLSGLSRGGWVDRSGEQQAALGFIRSLRIKAPSPSSDVAHLSGGNQQKILLARVLMNAPKIMLLDEPTKGVDVETRQEIYRLILDLADRGVTLLVVSSEIAELVGLCDRCLVLADGAIVDEFRRGEGSEARVIEATTTAVTS